MRREDKILMQEAAYTPAPKTAKKKQNSCESKQIKYYFRSKI